jgi:hypothetical protein
MKNSFSGNRRSRRQNSPAHSPAMIESLEIRALLAAPQIVTPVGTISNSTADISWGAVDGATSYDLWVTDVETREVLFVKTGLTSTHFTPTTELHLGRNRIWAKANFADASTTGWGVPTDVVLQTVPVITGPINAQQPATPFKLNETKPTITWNSPPGANSFEIFLSDQTTLTSKTFRVANLTPKLDGNGNTIPNGKGDVEREEIRSFTLPDALPMGQYRIFMRTTDDGGRVSAWTSAYDFEVAPAVKLLRPSGPSFQKAPLLEWEAVPGATHYEVWVNSATAPNDAPSMYPVKYLTTTSYQIPKDLADGNYVFSVRAKRLHQVTEIKLSGTPTSGSYRIVLTTLGTNGKTQQTSLLTNTATAAEIKAAIVALDGFENADVIGFGTAPNQGYLLQIPQTPGQVRVTVAGSVSPGTLTATTRYPAEVVGLWSAKKAFSTLQNPVITAPVGQETNNPDVRTVTDVRPTLEWTAIDKAARYEIWVDRTASSSTYLKTTSSTNSYTFEADIQPGNYWVWVRAISVTGQMTGWSTPYKFTATGGAPLITSPVNSALVLPLPTITWAAVPGAASYQIQIAWLGVNFEYIQRSGITSTEFAPVDPLNSGSYRVWVRAIKADGSALRWSTPVTFLVADAETETDSPFGALLLASVRSVLPTLVPVNAQPATQETHSRIENVTPEAKGFDTGATLAAESTTPVPSSAPADNVNAQELIQQLAERCTTEEWWNTQENS